MLRDQKGVALIVALIMLLILTLIGMSAISSTYFESKISGNDRFGASAFYAAKGGVDVGINQLPVTTAYSGNIGSDETYRSGHMTPGSPQPLVALGAAKKSGYDVSWGFMRYQVNATGQSYGAMKEIEVQVRYGPIKCDTSYNN